MVRADGSAVHHDGVHVAGVGDRLHDPVPMASIAPPVEAVVDRSRRPVFVRQIRPGNASAQDVKYAVDNAPVFCRELCWVGLP